MFNSSKKDLENLKDIYNLATAESDEEIVSDCLNTIEKINKKNRN